MRGDSRIRRLDKPMSDRNALTLLREFHHRAVHLQVDEVTVDVATSGRSGPRESIIGGQRLLLKRCNVISGSTAKVAR